MCVLCYALSPDEHWAEVVPDPAAVAGGSITFEEHSRLRGRRLRDRARRARYVSRLLRPFGLELQDWEGTSYILRDRKGRTAVVNSLAELWAEAERLAGAAIDPLDPALWSAMAAPAGRE